jgi:biotin transport system substrate-specific component
MKKKLSMVDLVLCALFTALIIAGTYIKIPISVVPITLQFLFTNLAGLLLGKKLGALSVGVFIILGLVGLPVFTGGSGIGYIFYPTFGYIIGYLIGTYAAGAIVEKSKKKSYKIMLIAGFSNLLIVYLFGLVHIYIIKNFYQDGAGITLWPLLLSYLLPFVPGDIIKCLVSAPLATRLRAGLQKSHARFSSPDRAEL